MIFSSIILVAFLANLYRYICTNEFKTVVSIIKEEVKNDLLYVESITVNITYNLLYCYSVAQIYYIKFTSWIKPHLYLLCSTINSLLDNHKQNLSDLDIDFYNKGKNMKTIMLMDNAKYILNDERSWINYCEFTNYCNVYDFFIVSDNTLSSNCINKIHYYNNNFVYQKSNIKFLSIELLYNNNTYPIELHGETYDHYIINNVINEQFLRYYLLNILSVEIEEPFIYILNILDHNVNLVTLSQDDYLIIKENDYEIVKKEITAVAPVVEEPVVEDPVVEEPVVEDPVVEDPLVEEPVTEEPVTEDNSEIDDFIELDSSEL